MTKQEQQAKMRREMDEAIAAGDNETAAYISMFLDDEGAW